VKKIVILLIFGVMIFSLDSCSKERKEWKKYKDKDSTQAYENYIKKYPNSKYVESAINEIWKNHKDKNTIRAYEYYIIKHPNSKYVKSAKNRIWELTENENSGSAFLNYIKKYPNSKYVESAINGYWEYVLELGSIQAFKGFIHNCPNSKYVESAKQRVNELMVTQGKFVSVTVSADLTGGKVSKLYYAGTFVLKSDDGKRIEAVCPKSLANNIKAGQILEVEFDDKLRKYKVTKIVEN